MADTVPITAGSGTTIGTDEVTIGGTLQHVQRVKLVDGTDGGTDLVPGTAARGLSVDARPLVVALSATPTITSGTAYASGDAVGSTMTFTSAARASGGSILVASATLADASKQNAAIDLVLFDSAPTAATNDAAWAPSAADLAKVVGVVPFTAYTTGSSTSITVVNNVGLEAVMSGSANLYGQLVVRATPTYGATNAIVVRLQIEQG